MKWALESHGERHTFDVALALLVMKCSAKNDVPFSQLGGVDLKKSANVVFLAFYRYVYQNGWESAPYASINDGIET